MKEMKFLHSSSELRMFVQRCSFASKFWNYEYRMSSKHSFWNGKLLSNQLTTGLLFGSRMFAVGSFKVASIYAPELYPTAVRSTGAMGRIGGMICPLVAVALVSECHLKEAVILFEAVIAVAVICILLFPFDTTGRQLDEINSAQPSLLS